MVDITCASYDQIAGRFAQLNEAMPGPVREAAEAFLQQTGTDSPILDLGCGPGRDLAWFEVHGAQAIGADLSAGMLDEARRRTSCPLIQMDMRRLAFGQGSLHGIWCNAALLHVSKAEAILVMREIHRVLGPGGLLDLTIQKGSDQGYEAAPFVDLKDVVRYFARYTQVEMREMLFQSDFRILQEDVATDRSKTWLHYLAMRLP